MKAPDPSRSCNISEEFAELTNMVTDLSPDNIDRLKNVGELLFEKDEIYTTADPLSQIFRKMCVENRITEAYFNEKYKQYAINTLGKLPQSAANNRANTVKMLKRGDRLSWKKFLEIVSLVLGLKLTDLKVCLTDKNNQVQSFSLDPK